MEPMARRTTLRSLVPRSLTPLALAVLCLGPLVACGGDEDPTADATTTSSSTTLPAMPADFDWWDPSPTPVGRGWVLERCTEDLLPATARTTVKGAPPSLLCFDHPDGRHGIVRLFRFLAPEDGDLNAHAARFVDDFIADRKQGCGEAYVVKAEPIVALDLSDGTARRYGFTGGASGAGTTERTVQWAGIRGDALEIITISVYDPGSCIVPDGEGTLAALEEVLPGIDALVQASGLQGPPPS
jgi:hypothetical protein